MHRRVNDIGERIAAVALRLTLAMAILAGVAAWRLEQDRSRYAHPGRVMTLTAQQSDCSRNSLFASGSGCESALGKVTFLSAGKK